MVRPDKRDIAMGVVIICVLFAAMTGVSAAATLTMGVIALPAMLKRGYDKSIAIILILAPICFPIVKSLGFNPVWFGILFVINMQMGYVTPPFGYQLFYLKSVAPEGVTTADIYKSVFPFLAVMIIGMVLIMIFPQIALWLPELMNSYAKAGRTEP